MAALAKVYVANPVDITTEFRSIDTPKPNEHILDRQNPS